MAVNFGILFYYMYGIEKTELDKFYIQVQNKINLYEQHANQTITLYQNEYKLQYEKNQDDYKKAKQEVELAYDKFYKEMDGEADDIRHSYASHQSGYEEVEYHFTGLDENLKSTFDDMENHYNKSALVQVYALLESELRRICNLLAKDFNQRITLDLFESRDYLDSIFKYFDYALSLDVSSLLHYQSKFKELQFLRNKIMHNGGEFNKGVDSALDGILKANPDTISISDTDENIQILHVKSGFVIPYYQLMRNFFFELFLLLNEKLSSAILIKRLQYFFGYLSNSISINDLKSKKVKNGFQYEFQIESNDFDYLIKYWCKLTIVESKMDAITITNQIESDKKVKSLVKHLEKNISLLKNDILFGFYKPNIPAKIQIMIYQV